MPQAPPKRSRVAAAAELLPQAGPLLHRATWQGKFDRAARSISSLHACAGELTRRAAGASVLPPLASVVLFFCRGSASFDRIGWSTAGLSK
jgi:hypothetical protein